MAVAAGGGERGGKFEKMESLRRWKWRFKRERVGFYMGILVF